MASNFSTANRMYFLTLAEYGENKLLIAEMTGRESLSDLFRFKFRLVSEREENIDPRKIIGKWAKLRIETYNSRTHSGQRHWSGFVSRFHRTGRTTSADGQDLYTYECDLVPWLWFMTRHQDIRIFQNLSIPSIIEKVLKDAGFQDFETNYSETHAELLYCTQYHETNYAFLSRLMQRAGIYAYYKHNQTGSHEATHTLVLTDNVDHNPDMDPAQVLFHQAGVAEAGDSITALQADFSMRTGLVRLRDWDFTQKKVLEANTPTCIPIGGNDAYEHYHYPGGHVEAQMGEYFTKVMMQAEEAAFLTLSGEGIVRQMEPGYRFKLDDHMFEGFNRKYLVVSVDHYGRNNLTNEAGPSDYRNRFTVQPHDVPYRSLRRTPQPRVHGPQTAIVTGASGDEIHTDEYGRIKVQFHWDRQGRYDDTSSCWVRVAQTWAGNGYGTMFIPRVGMEVVVDFLEGDPDQPIVTGCVYNGVNKPPYALPAEATKSTIKTLSSKGGGGTNELRFEDKKGHEEVFVQAEKNLQVRVKAARTESIGASRNTKIGAEDQTKIGGFQTLTVDGDQLVRVKGYALNLVDGDCEFGSQSSYLMLHGGTTTTVAGTSRVDVSSQEIALQATSKISLSAGGSFIVLDSSGVSIVGASVKINSGGAPLTTGLVSYSLPDYDANAARSTRDGQVTDPLQQLQAQALRNAARSGASHCAECDAARAALEAMAGGA